MPDVKLILVDDSPIIQALITSALAAAGYRVSTAGNWQELDRLLGGPPPDLILMDVNMPEILGDDALEYFKATRRLESTSILLFSDIDVTELEQRARACGADGFISKSWPLERLMETIENHLASRD